MRVSLAVVVLCLAGCGVAPPDLAAVRAAHRPSEAWLLDRHGEVVDVHRVDFAVRRLPWTPLADISAPLVAATIAAEDRRFASHPGVDVRALAAAAIAQLRGEARRGASTITMQVAASLDPSLQAEHGTRSASQKLRQIGAALVLERRWSKDEVLEAYFNRVDYRGELSGIGAATSALLGKSPAGVDEAEAAVLAALLRAPNAGAATLSRRACAVAARARFATTCAAVGRVAAQIAAAGQVISMPAADAPDVARLVLRRGGERVVTTLDARVQRATRRALAEQLAALGPRNVRDGAAVVLDNASGDVLAWVGSAGPASRAAAVDGVRAVRQAGSTLKPFLYALLLERHYLTAASLLDDSPLALETPSGLYIPQNYDTVFRGPVSVRVALAESLNVPAVRALTLVGVEAFRDRLRALGYDSIREPGDFYGFALALGSAEVSLLAQANAYRTLANGGRFAPVRLRPEEVPAPPRAIVDPAAAFIVADILSDRGSRARAFGLDSVLGTRVWSAVKTGTSKDMRDNWCVGFTRRHTVAVWVGNFEGDSMQDVSGVSGAAPAWLAIVNALSDGATEATPAPPRGVVAADVRFHHDLEPPRREWFVEGTVLTRVERADPRRRERIVAPAHGAILALDPDIPPAFQRVAFEAHAASGATMRLDGVGVDGHAGWLPVPGTHRLELLVDGEVRDAVSFMVRAP